MLCAIIPKYNVDINKLSNRVIGAAIETDKIIGPGLLESAYEECLCHEFSLRSLSFERHKPLPVVYKGKTLDCGYRLDIFAFRHLNGKQKNNLGLALSASPR